MSVEAVLFDFYGTLAQATRWVSIDVVLAEHGVELPTEVRDRWWNDGIDGVEHLEHSHSRNHYVAWQRQRLLTILAETDLHPGEYEVVVSKLQKGNQARVLEPYPESLEVLTDLPPPDQPLALGAHWARDHKE